MLGNAYVSITEQSLVQVMAFHLLTDRSLPEPVMISCELSLTEQTSANLNQTKKIMQNAPENSFHKMWTIFSRHQYVNIEYMKPGLLKRGQLSISLDANQTTRPISLAKS